MASTMAETSLETPPCGRRTSAEGNQAQDVIEVAKALLARMPDLDEVPITEADGGASKQVDQVQGPLRRMLAGSFLRWSTDSGPAGRRLWVAGGCEQWRGWAEGAGCRWWAGCGRRPH